MSGLLFTTAAFILAISLLVTVHEFGHFWVARRAGVKVLRFSIGFGKPIYTRRFGRDRTEFVIAAIPLGGYVKMLDEREAPVPESELDRAFNRKPVGARIAIVVAGPAFNFLFALFVYWVMFVSGVPGIKPIVGPVLEQSPAAQAGFETHDRIVDIDGREVRSWDEALLALLGGALDKRELHIRVQGGDGIVRERIMGLRQVDGLLDKGNLLEKLGLEPWRPVVEPVFGELVPGEPAAQAGIHPGDRILSADGQSIGSWNEWVDFVRTRPDRDINLWLERDGSQINIRLRPARVELDGVTIGRIGALPRVPPDTGKELRVDVRYGPFEAVSASVQKCWEISTLTLRTLWKMLIGEASVENISGPLTIAQIAGQTASIGLASFLGFLGLVSISLGVLNLLPIPVLDGGHLLYYLIELLKGSPLSEQAEALGQRIGIALLLALMSLAVVNDLMRLLD